MKRKILFLVMIFLIGFTTVIFSDKFLETGAVGLKENEVYETHFETYSFFYPAEGGAPSPLDPPIMEEITQITVLQNGGNRLSWNLGEIIYDTKNDSGYMDIFIMADDGTDSQCITCNNPGISQNNNGNPEFHPGGEFVIFQSENPNLEGLDDLVGPWMVNYMTSPGVGIHNNIWIMNRDGTEFWQVTDVDDLHGTIHPHFSRDGTKVIWSQLKEPVGEMDVDWVIVYADFIVTDGIPGLRNVTVTEPLDLGFYEVDGFSLNNEYITFMGAESNTDYFGYEKYLHNLETDETWQLTDDEEWDGQMHFINNDQQMIFVSSTDISQIKSTDIVGITENPPKLDYWIMNSDGTGLRRLTGFNDPDSIDYIESDGGIGLGDFHISGDGRILFGKMRRDRNNELVRIDLAVGNCGNGFCGQYENETNCPADCLDVPGCGHEDCNRWINKDVSILQGNSGHPSFSPNGDKIVFDKLRIDGFYDVSIMDLEGNIIQDLTFGDGINQRHNGWPVWHPDGEIVIFQSEESFHYNMDNIDISSPAVGMYNNLWATEIATGESWRLTSNPVKMTAYDGIIPMATLAPVISHDGTKLMWSEKYEPGNGMGDWGEWRLMMADIYISQGCYYVPGYGNNCSIHAVQVGGIETIIDAQTICADCNFVMGMAYSPNDDYLLVTGNLDGQQEHEADNYIYDLQTGEFSNLHGSEALEGLSCWSNDGRKIVYLSDAVSEYIVDYSQDWQNQPRTFEYFIMDYTGSNQEQMSFFNSDGSDDNSITYDRRVITDSCDWAPNNTVIAGTIGVDQNFGDTSDFKTYVGLFSFNTDMTGPICGDDICEVGENGYICPADCPLPPLEYEVKAVTELESLAGRVDWSKSGNDLVIYDKQDADDYYDIFSMNSDGTGKVCLTCDEVGISEYHTGNPAWHPDGDWIVFQSVDIFLSGMDIDQYKQKTNPGAGWLNTLWLMDSEATEFHQLNTLDSLENGVLHPHFSHDGTKLFWSERHGIDDWRLMVADFNDDVNPPILENSQEYTPGYKNLWYESHGFTEDDSELIFSGSLEFLQPFHGMDIYRYDYINDVLTPLTDTHDVWDEHASLSPDGEKIVWMSSSGYTVNPLITDFWLMDIDGSNKKRLTFFNDDTWEHYLGYSVTAADSSWSPDGRNIMAYMKTDIDGLGSTGGLFLIELE